MSGRALLSLLLLLVCSGLSCSLREPPPVAISEVRVPAGPNALEWIEGRFSSHATGLSPDEIRAVSRALEEHALRNSIDRELVMAVIHTESGFQNFARSRVGALGLMQIMPDTGEMLAAELGIPWKGPDMLFDPVVNIAMGTRYLAMLHARYSSWDGALAAYNWGPARIDGRLRRGRQLPVRYVAKVMGQLQSPATP